MTAATFTPVRFRQYLTAALVMGATLAVTYTGLRRYEMGRITPAVSAITQEVCGFGGRDLNAEGMPQIAVQYAAEIVKNEPIWKRVGICALTVYQPVRNDHEPR